MPQLTLAEEQPPRKSSGGVVPPLKWAGGKRWLVEHLRPMWSEYPEARLVEPFAGGLAIALDFQPKKAVLNDINGHLINFYNHLKSGLVCDIDATNSDPNYYARRDEFNALIRAKRAIGKHDDGKRAAMLFYYLNRHCYNGLCRFNKSGEFNTPAGEYVNPKYTPDLTAYSGIVKGWKFTSGDFADVDLQKGDFLYCDPPYDDAYTGYSKDGFGYADQKRLAEWASEHDGPAVISNHATQDMLALYEECGFDTSLRLPAPRMIHCFGDRTPALEVVATKIP